MKTEMFKKIVTRFCLLVAATGLLGMMGLTVVEIIMRLGFHNSILGIYEYNEILLMYSTLFGLVYAYSKDLALIKVELFTMLFSDTMSRIANSFVLVFSFFLFLLLAYSASLATYEDFISGEYRFGLVPMPIWPLKLSAAICGLLMIPLISGRIIWLIRSEWLRCRNAASHGRITDDR